MQFFPTKKKKRGKKNQIPCCFPHETYGSKIAQKCHFYFSYTSPNDEPL